MFLSVLEQILSVAAPLAVVTGVIVALLQLRNQNRLRQFDAVMRLFGGFGQEAFLRHYRRVTTWPYETYEAFKKDSTEDDYLSLMIVSVFYENMGLLYKRGFAPLDLLDDLNSAPIVTSWRKVKPIWEGLRAEYRQPQWAEYHQMLSEAMIDRLARLDKQH